MKSVFSRSAIIAICIAVSVGGCSDNKSGSAAPPAGGANTAAAVTEVVIAQWGQEKYLIYLPIYVAQEAGLFSSRGLTTRLKYSGNDDATFATVLAGEALVGVGDPSFAAIAAEKGVGARVIGTIVGGVSIWGVTKNPAIPVIARPEQLRNLRIGTFPEPSTNYTLMKRLIDSTPALRGSTRIVQAPIGSQVALLEGRRADIAMELEPGASVAESQGYRVVYSSPKFHGPFAFTGLTTTTRVIEEKRDLLQRVVDALEEAVVMCHAERQRCVDIAERVFPSIPQPVVAAAVGRMLDEGTLPQHVSTTSDAWQATLSVRLAVGDLRAPQATEQVVDNSFANAAAERLKNKSQ